MSLLALKAKSPEALMNAMLAVGGKVVGETKNTFTFLREGQAKNVIKESAVFNFKFDDGTVVEIDGKLLVGRSEDRLKKSIKRLW